MNKLVSPENLIKSLRPRSIAGFIVFFLFWGGLGIGGWYYQLGMEFWVIDVNDVPGPPPEARDNVNPRPCIGWEPQRQIWGHHSQLCPKNYAYYSNAPVAGTNKSGPGEYVQLYAQCCPLPADDILTDQHSYTEFERCPDQWVTTGSMGLCSRGCAMRCTKINQEKYRLDAETQSVFWKVDMSKRAYSQGGARKVWKEDIPPALFYGLGRKGHNLWETWGCVGFPFGSLLTRKISKRCDGFYYRRLLYLDGTPVKMLPDCDSLSDIYDPSPACIKTETPK